MAHIRERDDLQKEVNIRGGKRETYIRKEDDLHLEKGWPTLKKVEKGWLTLEKEVAKKDGKRDGLH